LSATEKKLLVHSLRASVEAKTKGKKSSRRTLEDAFRELDIDKSETISMDEFMVGTARFLQGVPSSKVRALYSVFDTRNSGQLSVNVFIQTLLEGDAPPTTDGGVTSPKYISNERRTPLRPRTKRLERTRWWAVPTVP
jgi:hypothetical protein